MIDESFTDDLDQMKPISIVSGGFDPLHSGHIALIEGAARKGRVLVILNSDNWLSDKKGQPFMHWEERAAILRALRAVTTVIGVDDSDGTVCGALRAIAAHYSQLHSPRLIFCNGGDRTETTTPEQDVCRELGIDLAFRVGGGKTQSSSDLLKNWTGFEPIDEACGRVTVCAGDRLTDKERRVLAEAGDQVADEILRAEPSALDVTSVKSTFKCVHCGSFGPLSRPCECLNA
jgi:D-beta-D-heptose 7-phosphate kinase/D-beta-D-heptose 1-phosphate adenosyltransferase